MGKVIIYPITKGAGARIYENVKVISEDELNITLELKDNKYEKINKATVDVCKIEGVVNFDFN